MEVRSTPERSRRAMHNTQGASARDVTNRQQQGDLKTVDVVKGPSGFGFTLTDSEDGQQLECALSS